MDRVRVCAHGPGVLVARRAQQELRMENGSVIMFRGKDFNYKGLSISAVQELE